MTQDQGMTLPELLVALTIFSILAFVGIPSFVDLIHRQRHSSAVQILYQALTATREEAVNRQQVVSLWNTDGNWQGSLEIFRDTDRDGIRDETEDVIRQLETPGNLLITGNRWVKQSVSYFPDGSAHTASGAFQVGTITLCHPGSTGVSKLILSIGGRVRREFDKNADCE